MAHRPRRGSRGRKFDIYRTSTTFNITTSGSAGVLASNIIGGFKTTYGADPFQATLSIPRFEVASVGVGTGTGLNSFTLAFCVGPNTLDANDLDPVANPDQMWWDRKFYLQNNSNPAGIPWGIQGVDALNYKVNTRRTLKTLGDTLFASCRADFTGFTEIDVTLDLQVGILYA